jgi:hypothetical protein
MRKVTTSCGLLQLPSNHKLLASSNSQRLERCCGLASADPLRIFMLLSPVDDFCCAVLLFFAG